MSKNGTPNIFKELKKLYDEKIKVKEIAKFKRNYKKDDSAEEQLTKFLSNSKTSNLKKLYCVGINTGYTHRLIKELAVGKCAKPLPSVVFTDSSWKPDLGVLINDEEMYSVVKRLKKEDVDGCVFYKTSGRSVENALGYISILDEIEYCNQCVEENVHEVTWYETDGKIIAIVIVDTESG